MLDLVVLTRGLRTGLFVLTIAVFSSVPLCGQESDQKEPRFDFTPQGGYRTAVSFSIQPHVQGTNPRLVLEANPSYGFAFGARIHGDDMVEFRWMKQDSSGHFEEADLTTSLPKLTLNQFHGDFSHEYLVEDWAKWARPFVMLSVGATHISGSTTFTRFSFGVGGGIRFYPQRHFGFKVQAEWLPILVDPYGAVVCGAGCVVQVGGTVSSQGEVSAGPIFRF